MNELRKLSNQLTLLRIVLVPVLWALAALKMNTAFAIFLLTAGLTDALDGIAARMQKQKSDFGIWFDSFADNLVAASAAFWTWLLLPEFVYQNLVIISILVALFVLSLSLGFIKYGKMVDYHMYAGKLSAVFLYVFVAHSLLFTANQIFLYITAAVIATGLLEEILVTLKYEEFQKDKKSIFS